MKLSKINEQKIIVRNDANSESKNKKERVSFTLPSINGDQQVYLGQSIVALIGVNMPTYFSDEQNKENLGLMFIDILKHYNISIEELYKMDVLENRLDPDYYFEIEVELKHKVISKTKF